MKFIFGIKNFKTLSKGCVLTIGNFDGVHLGHQSLLKTLCKEGNKRKLPKIVILFEPHPIKFFKKKAPKKITYLREKIFYLSQKGIDTVICIHFNHIFAKQSAQNFIDTLIKKLIIKVLVIGNDFSFGAKREGDIFLLKKAAIKYGFTIIRKKTFFYQKKKISSTLIRKILKKGNLKLARILLGHDFIFSGHVIYGNGLGKKIGFPTANISLRNNVLAIKGVYAVKVYGINKNPIFGVANIGNRPTFFGKYQCEIHLLNIKMNLYGHFLKIVFFHKIRNEKKFNSITELQYQIKKDILITKKIFNFKNLKDYRKKKENKNE